MAGSIPASDLAERRAGGARWKVVRRAARARMAPFGAVVMVLAVLVALAVVTGTLLGILAGYCGGRVDGLVMRLMDAVLSFPPLVLALALGAVLGAGLGGVLLALGVVYTPTFARLMRGQVLTITAPWIVFGPGAALFVTVVGLNFVGDAVRDALDPRTWG